MSYYYCYRLGYRKDGKLYPLYPFTSDGKWTDVISHSRTYDTRLHDNFYSVNIDMLSDEFKNKIIKNLSNDNRDANEYINDTIPYLKWLPIDELPKGEFVKRGYFLISDVETYEKDIEEGGDGSGLDIFYDNLNIVAYNARLKNAMMLGDDCIKDENGDIIQHSIKDYMYYAYPDYWCKEYYSFVLRRAASECEYLDIVYKNGGEIVVIDWEG